MRLGFGNSGAVGEEAQGKGHLSGGGGGEGEDREDPPAGIGKLLEDVGPWKNRPGGMSVTGALRASQGPGRLSAVLIIVFFCVATIPVTDMPLGTYVANRGAVKGTRPPGDFVPWWDGENPNVGGAVRSWAPWAPR